MEQRRSSLRRRRSQNEEGKKSPPKENGTKENGRKKEEQDVQEETMDVEPVEEEATEELRVEIEETENVSEQILDGTDPTFMSQNQEFERVRNIQLKTAELHRTLQTKNNQDLLDFNTQRAHDLYENECKELYDTMLATAEAKLQKLQQKLQKLQAARDNPGNGPTTHRHANKIEPPTKKIKLPKRKTIPEKLCPKAPEEVEALTNRFVEKLQKAWSLQQKAFPNPSNVTMEASASDIMKDVQTIYTDWTHIAATTKLQSVHASCAGGKLQLEDRMFDVGDLVIVSSPFSKQDYHGKIRSVTSDAVYIELESGRKARVYLDYLRNKRCSMAPRTAGITAIPRLRQTGWVN